MSCYKNHENKKPEFYVSVLWPGYNKSIRVGDGDMYESYQYSRLYVNLGKQRHTLVNPRSKYKQTNI